MNMNCDRFEELLPAYAEDDLVAKEKAEVDAHLDTCESCRESLAFFADLESSLVARRALRPSDAAVAALVTGRLGLGRRKSFRFAGVLSSVPAAISTVLVVLGVVLFAFRGAVAQMVSRAGEIRYNDDFRREVVDGVSSMLGSASAVSELTWTIMYLGVFALILLTGSWMVLKHVRDY